MNGAWNSSIRLRHPLRFAFGSGVAAATGRFILNTEDMGLDLLKIVDLRRSLCLVSGSRVTATD